jgi:hypothetical protein
MLVLDRSTRFMRVVVLAVASLALALTGCTGAAGESAPASPPASVAGIASATPTALASSSPEPSVSASASVEPGEEDDEGSPTPKPTPIPGCGTGESGFLAIDDKFDHLLTFGDSDIELTTAGIAMRDDSYVASDSIPGHVGLTKDERAVRVGPGERVRLVGDGMTFPEVIVAFASWSDVDFDTDPPTLAGTLTEGMAVVAANDTVAIVAPTAPGDYEVELSIHWQSRCVKGDGTAYGRLKVG